MTQNLVPTTTLGRFQNPGYEYLMGIYWMKDAQAAGSSEKTHYFLPAKALLSACQAIDGKEPGWEKNSIAAAVKIQEMACNLTTDGIQVMGGAGYMKDFGQEKRFRDAKHIQALFGMTPRKKLKYFESII